MIPQNFKDVLGHTEHAGLLQSIAMILFMLVFIGSIFYVMNKPKGYYNEAENTPLDDDQPFN